VRYWLAVAVGDVRHVTVRHFVVLVYMTKMEVDGCQNVGWCVKSSVLVDGVLVDKGLLEDLV
jgi:hypothetical protein